VGWDFKVNTSTMINGPYEISARSYDGEAYSETARIQVTVFNEGQKWPDLAVAANDIIFSPKLPEKNKLVTISASVSNLGNLNVTNVAVRFQRENVLIGETQIGLVPSGENRTTSVQWVALLGDHLIKVIVDPDNIIVELNETDNEASRMITVVPSTFYQPDLEISAQNITLSSNEIKAGDSVVLTAEVFNFGNEGATNTAVTFVVDGNQVGKPNIDYVPINSSRAARVTWIATVGHHTINVTVDLDNQTVERNESNNRASISIDVKASGSSFPVWIIVVGVAIPLVLAVAIMYVMKWRRPKY
jgi:subtilase family serine protease